MQETVAIRKPATSVNALLTKTASADNRQPAPTTPVRATLRLQFHSGFTLDDALPLVPYFARLGISHIYASPLLTARAGSTHGYDVVDPTRINPELGGEPALRRLMTCLRRHNMGLILDIVSNHMAVGGSDNPWWRDVLEWGQASPYASFFDIQWQSQDPLMDAQLLVPFLRTDYGDALTKGDITLHFDAEQGSLYMRHFEHLFPLAPPTYADVLCHTSHGGLLALAERFAALGNDSTGWYRAYGLRSKLYTDPALREAASQAVAAFLDNNGDNDGGEEASDAKGTERLHLLLERQHYRLASWRTAADDINWRRFFDINELGGLRVENPLVFEALHGKVFALIAEGLVDGLRIDHIDGLANPRAYCRKLRRRVDRLLPERPGELARQHFPIYVEKILGAGEQMPDDWGVDGTTGYDFMNQVSLLQHDAQGELPLRELWNRISGRSADFTDEVREARQLVLTSTLAGDFENVAQGLLLIARNDLVTRDFTLGAIRRALFALIVHFPVYRTYAGAGGRRPGDNDIFTQALDGARTTLAEQDWPLLEHLDRWLGGTPYYSLPPKPLRHLRRKVLARFQQLTSPAAAKAVEDTACYRAGVLQSRYDVGFDPQRFSTDVEEFHRQNQLRAERFPHALLASATHDHKRGEDTRARLAAVSERSSWFAYYLQHWQHMAQPLVRPMEEEVAPSPGDEILMYQTLLGSWPLDLGPNDDNGLRRFEQRLQQWLCKMLREAKLRSSWSAPNRAYEEACSEFLNRLLLSPETRDLREDIAEAVAAIAPAGALNALSQCLLRLTSPGIPDLFQGCELWDFSLVDPDNRRPVDFGERQQALAAQREPDELVRDWRSGHIKQWLITRALALRAQEPALFADGDYLPLKVEGAKAKHVLAFARRLQDRILIVVVPYLAAPLLGDTTLPQVQATEWGNTRIVLPDGIAAGLLRDLRGDDFPVSLNNGSISNESGNRELDGEPANAGELGLAHVLGTLPVNVLLSVAAPLPVSKDPVSKDSHHERH